MDQANQLGEGKVINLLLKYSIPAIVGMIVNALYNIVDRIFIGHGVGTLAITGLTVGFPIMNILMAFGMLVGVGATSLISIRLGEQKKDEAEQILGNAAMLLIIISISITCLGLIFLNPILKIFGASNEALPYANQYLSIILAGSIFQAIGFGLNNSIRAQGSPKIAMATMLIGAVLNTILDPIFIFVLGLGVQGAALATILSQAVSAAWVLHFFLSGRSVLKLQIKNIRLSRSIALKILAIGSAPFALQMGASVLNAVLNKTLSTYGGDVAIAAMGVIMSVNMLILMPIFGINQGSQPIIGYNYGAKKFHRVKETLKLAILAATAVAFLGFVATRLFPHQLIGLFNSEDKELLKVGSRALSIFLMMLPIVGFQIVSSNYFQATGKPKQAMFLSISRQFLLLIPALMILPRFFGLDGAWMAGPVSDVGAFLITGFWLYKELKHLDERHEVEAESL